MSSLVYLGSPPRSGQVVSDSIREKGLELIRAAPRDFNANVWNDDIFPSHAMYIRNIHQFVEVARLGKAKYVLLGGSAYAALDWTGLPTTCKTPLIAFSFHTKIKEEKWAELKDIYGARDTIMKGRPALLARLGIDQMKRLLAEENPITTTPTNDSCININAYRAYLTFHRIYDAICRTNQYPCYADKGEGERTEVKKRMVVDRSEGQEEWEMDDDPMEGNP
jgi:hypothetical protein